MPATKVFDGCPMKYSKSFKTEPEANKYRKACNKQGLFARKDTQSGPRVTNPWVVYTAKTCPGKGKFGPGR